MFNIWYYRSPPWDTGIAPPELMDFIATHPPGRALDLGCGTGTNAIALAEHGWQVTGVDFARRAITEARKKAHHMGVEVDLRVADVTVLKSIHGPFELILDIGCFHTLSTDAKERYGENLHRLLAPDGTYLMYGFFKDPENTGIGLSPADLDALRQRLELVGRQDGTERGFRPSAWFTFRQRMTSD